MATSMGRLPRISPRGGVGYFLLSGQVNDIPSALKRLAAEYSAARQKTH